MRTTSCEEDGTFCASDHSMSCQACAFKSGAWDRNASFHGLIWTLWSWGWCYWNLLASEKRWREHGSNYKLEHRFGRPTFSPLWAGMSESRPGILYFWRCQLNRENDGFGDFTVSLTVSPSSVGPHMIQMFQKEKMLGAGRGFRDDPGRVNQPHSAWGPCSQMPVKFWICCSLTLSPACKLLHLSKPLFPVS